MYIRKLGRRYQCQVRVRNQSYYKTFVDKTSARLWGHETYLSAMKGVLLGNGLKKTLKELIEKYIAEFTVTKKSKVKETKIWERLIRNHSWLTNKRVINLTPQDFIKFINILFVCRITGYINYSFIHLYLFLVSSFISSPSPNPNCYVNSILIIYLCDLYTI